MGDIIEWWGFSSCTNNMNILQSELFLGKTNVRTMFTIECHNGKDICKHSYFASEDEILLLPGTQFKIISSLDQGDLKLIHLQEIIPHFPLLHPIPSSSSKFNKTENTFFYLSIIQNDILFQNFDIHFVALHKIIIEDIIHSISLLSKTNDSSLIHSWFLF
jgi:hypothetical protein